MRYLFIVFLFISSFISGQGIEPTSLQPTQYQGGILRGVIPYVDEFTGETLYIYQHVDSLVFVKDSIYVRNDSIFLRDGTGFAIVTDSIYVVEGATKDTIKLRDGDGYVLMDKQSQSRVRGTGTATRVAWWAKSDSLSSSANLYWDTLNQRLGIGTITPTKQLTTTDDIYINSMHIGEGGGSSYTNLIMGQDAGRNMSSALFNCFVGYNSGYSFTTGSQNLAYGYAAMQGSSSASANNNVAVGNFSLLQLLSGEGNMAIGNNSLYSLTTGSYNVGVGVLSLQNNVSGSYNVGIGFQALRYTTGSNNIGINGGTNITTGYQNVEIGAYGTTTGYQNVLIGTEAGNSVAAGYGNVMIGRRTGWSAYNQSGNVFIGNLAGFSETTSNKLYIENDSGTPLIGGNFATNVVGINTPVSSIARSLHVTGEVRITDLTTDAATKLVGADNDGDLSSVTVGNGLNIDAGTLTVTANINGTQNRVAKFTNQYTVGNSEIYTVGDTLVGINQSNPQYHLDVNGKFRVSQRTGTAATGAGFTADGQLIAYSLDTAEATPNTYVQSGTSINITGAGTMGDPYTINNTAPENTSVKDGTHLDFSELSNDTITASIIAGSIGSTEIASTSVTPGTYNYATVVVDADGRITSASSNTDLQGVSSITAESPLTGGTITTSGTIGISNARANDTQKGAATFKGSDFDDDAAGLISLDYTNGQSASGSTKGFLTSTDWTTFNNKWTGSGSGTSGQATYWNGTSSIAGSPNFLWTNADSMLTTRNLTVGRRDLTATTIAGWSSGGVATGMTQGHGITISGGTLRSSRFTVDGTNWFSGDLHFKTENVGTSPAWVYAGGDVKFRMPAATNGQVLKSNGTNWIVGTDNDTDTDAQSLTTPSWNTGTGVLTTGISGGSGTTIDLDGRYLTAEVDGSTTNEIQGLSYNTGTRALGITSGSGVTLPLVTSIIPGLVSAYPNNTTSFLRGDGTWATPPTPSVTGTAPIVVTSGNISLNIGTGLYSTSGSLTNLSTNYGYLFHSSGTIGGQSISTTPLTVNFNDQMQGFNMTCNTSSDYVQVTNSGGYEIDYGVCVGGISSTRQISVQVYVGSSSVAGTLKRFFIDSGDEDCAHGKHVMDLTAGQQVFLKVATSGSETATFDGPQLKVTRIY